MTAPSPDAFKPSERVKVFTAADIDVEGVKDPVVYLIGGLHYAIVSYAPSPRTVTVEAQVRMHATADVFNTGITKSHTGLAVSSGGVRFLWQGDIFAPRDSGWDVYTASIDCLLYQPPVWLAFYDNAITVSENYEGKIGLALTFNLRRFERVSTEDLILTAPPASAILRASKEIISSGSYVLELSSASPLPKRNAE